MKREFTTEDGFTIGVLSTLPGPDQELYHGWIENAEDIGLVLTLSDVSDVDPSLKPLAQVTRPDGLVLYQGFSVGAWLDGYATAYDSLGVRAR